MINKLKNKISEHESRIEKMPKSEILNIETFFENCEKQLKNVRKSFTPPGDELISILTAQGPTLTLNNIVENSSPVDYLDVTLSPTLPSEWTCEIHPNSIEKITPNSLGNFKLEIAMPIITVCGNYRIIIRTKCDYSEVKKYLRDEILSESAKDLFRLTEGRDRLSKISERFRNEIEKCLRDIESYEPLGSKIYNLTVLSKEE